VPTPGFGFREKNGVAYPSFWFVGVKIARYGIVITTKDDGLAGFEQRLCVAVQPLEPSELIIELGSWRGIPVGQINAAHPNVIHACFYIATVRIVRITWKSATCFRRRHAPRENCHPVPALLSMPDCLISLLGDFGFGKSFLGRTQFLQARDVRLFFLQPQAPSWDVRMASRA
jgi:hypothetical protein